MFLSVSSGKSRARVILPPEAKRQHQKFFNKLTNAVSVITTDSAFAFLYSEWVAD